MTTKHTPGTWEAYSFRESEDVRGAMVRVMRPATDATRANPDICRVYAMGDDGRPGGEMEANARLIAAAPSMHEALMRLAVIHPDGPCWCDCTGAGRPMNAHLCPPHVHTEECDAARAAIAQAEGRA
jgi:hypothetical protein